MGNELLNTRNRPSSLQLPLQLPGVVLLFFLGLEVSQVVRAELLVHDSCPFVAIVINEHRLVDHVQVLLIDGVREDSSEVVRDVLELLRLLEPLLDNGIVQAPVVWSE